jgi:hypothetical protein
MAKINAMFNKYKIVLSFFIMLPYLVIGFSEAMTEMKFDENFKANMWYVCIVGLSVPFGSEMLQIMKAYTSNFKIVKHDEYIESLRKNNTDNKE